MEFCIGLFVGLAAGVMGTVFVNSVPQSSADKHLDSLNAQAKKNLQKLQQSRNQIAQVSTKAGSAHRELKSQISELAGEE